MEGEQQQQQQQQQHGQHQQQHGGLACLEAPSSGPYLQHHQHAGATSVSQVNHAREITAHIKHTSSMPVR
eukprot:1159260-Pelagomonas_calceolata.AAC.5